MQIKTRFDFGQRVHILGTAVYAEVVGISVGKYGPVVYHLVERGRDGYRTHRSEEDHLELDRRDQDSDR